MRHAFLAEGFGCLATVHASTTKRWDVVADNEGAQLCGLTPEEAARLRAQMEELLRGADQARAASAGDEAGARSGREMWARCAALTAGVCGMWTALPPCSVGLQFGRANCGL